MSLTARLHLKEHNFFDRGLPVLSCDFSFNQDMNAIGEAKSIVRGGIINLTLRGIDDPEILQWMMGTNTLKDGMISFTGFTTEGVGRKIEFSDGFLVSYHESFTNESDIVVQLVISCRQLTISGVEHENKWSKPGRI